MLKVIETQYLNIMFIYNLANLKKVGQFSVLILFRGKKSKFSLISKIISFIVLCQLCQRILLDCTRQKRLC